MTASRTSSLVRATWPSYLVALSNPSASPEFLPERPGCTLPQLGAVAVPSGDYADFYDERDHRRRMDRLTAATLMVHGSADRRVSPLTQAGMFDAIPASTPRAGLFGVWAHEGPDQYAANAPLPAPTGSESTIPPSCWRGSSDICAA